MALVDFTLDEHVALVTLNDGENRFNPSFLNAFLETLDQIESQTQATTMVVHSSHEKIFSNGIDLDWLLARMAEQDFTATKSFFYQLESTLKRVATYPLVSIAAISGHAFAGGAIFSSAFDFRFMRSDRGYFCLPEVDLSIPFLPGMNAVLRSAIPEPVLQELQLTGMRLTAEMCLNHQIVKGAIAGDELLAQTMAYAKQINKQRPIVAELKARLNSAVVHAIDVEDVAYIESGRLHVT